VQPVMYGHLHLRVKGTHCRDMRKGKTGFAGQVEMPHEFFREERCLDVEPEYCFVGKKISSKTLKSVAVAHRLSML